MEGRQYSPLTLAAQRGRLEEVRALLDGGAGIDDQDGDGFTALTSAARFGKLEVVELLLARGADPNALTSHRKTALMDAADEGHLEIVKRLLASGADPTLRSKGGTTALKVARIYGNTEIAELLEQALFPPNRPPRRYARTNAEAHLYMDMQPCNCGALLFEWHYSVITDDGVRCSRYAGQCWRCGQQREFVFEVPETGIEGFGGAEPSRLLDPGEWMAVALDRAMRGDLAFAHAALEEVAKFIPAGAERVPDEAFTTELGRAVRNAVPEGLRTSSPADVRRLFEAIAADADVGFAVAEFIRNKR